MIAQFPTMYPDELLYSVLARYHQRTGRSILSTTIKELYSNPTRPSFLFLNRFSPDALSWLTKQGTIGELIEKHTMFPYYMRFHPLERRKAAFDALVNQEKNLSYILFLPKTANQPMRFCPLCVHEDRTQYGETYWHRAHQIRDVRICPKHRCFLESSTISFRKHNSPDLVSAELLLPLRSSTTECQDETEIRFAGYLLQLFQSPMDYAEDSCIGEYLNEQLHKKYRSQSGLFRHITQFYDDFSSFFANAVPIASMVQVQKVFNGYLFDTFFVAQLAFFEGISVEDLSHWHTFGLQTVDADFYQQLANQYGVDVQTVSQIGQAVLSQARKQGHIQRKSGPKQRKWLQYDEETFPKVKAAVDRIYFAEGRPQRCSVSRIEKELLLAPKQLNSMPKCLNYIQEHTDPMNVYWAKEITWAIQDIEEKNEKMQWKSIRTKTNLNRVRFYAAIPHIQDVRIRLIAEELAETYKESE